MNTVKIEDQFGNKIPVECFYQKGGLAVTRSLSENRRGYFVSHLMTGYKIDPLFKNKRLARKFLDQLTPLTDWNKIKTPEQAKRSYALKKKVSFLQKNLLKMGLNK